MKIRQKIASCDIETSCGVKDCPDYGKSHGKCKHATHHLLNKLDIIGVYDGKKYINFGNDVRRFDKWTMDNEVLFVGHGFKFDFKTLKAKGSKITLSKHYHADTNALGACVQKKVSDGYLKLYNEKRKELNAKLPTGQRHRVGSPLSLKTMAPFYLKTEPFWENPETHDDPEYNKLDCVYTYDLYYCLKRMAEKDGTWNFFTSYLMPWQKLLTNAELEGVLIDEEELHRMYEAAVKETFTLEQRVHKAVRGCFHSYREGLERELRRDSIQRANSYIQKRVKDKTKHRGILQRYADSLEEKIKKLPTHFNLGSSQQVMNILNFAGIDTLVDKRDKESNEWIEKEGTDKFVLKRAWVTKKNKIAKLLLDYREKQTEVTYLKGYIEACVGGRIYCTFNITGTRTGRLSSAGPNLQNVKGSLRLPFIIADPKKYSIYTVDASQIEPRGIAYLSQDKKMVKLFQDGRDYHNYATHLFFPETRKTPEADIKKVYPHLRNDVAKHGDLSCIYGTGPLTLKNMILVRGDKDVPIEKCRKWVIQFKDGMKTVLDYKRKLEEKYENGAMIQDPFGFPVNPGGSVYMTLLNSLNQGMCSRMIFHASLLAFRQFCKEKIDAVPLSWVHDEVIWRFPKGKEKYCQKVVDKYMTAYKLDTRHGRVPLKCEGHLGDRWQK